MGEAVFGYGSLASPTEAHKLAASGEPEPIDVLGYARRWTVAMVNCAPENDAKHYVDADTGDRPDIYIAFLNIEPDPDAACNGVAIPVTHSTLDTFDRREVNYTRSDVSAATTPAWPGRLWGYTGTPEAVNRFQIGLAERRVYYPREYARYCRDAFASLGPGALRRYDETTEPPLCPARDLVLRRM